MKLVCLMLIAAMFSCTYQGHVTPWPENMDNAGLCSASGKLSEIVTEIIAIPLDTTPYCRLGSIKQVRRDGGDLFILSGGKLYHFDRSGRYINMLKSSDGSDFPVRDYVLDPVRKRLIVLGAEQAVHYFSYTGLQLARKELRTDCSWLTLIKLSHYNDHIWITANNLVPDKNDNTITCYEKWLYKFDMDFNFLESVKLHAVDLGRPCLCGNFSPEFSVVDDKLYAYSPSAEKDELLRDTLYLVSTNRLEPTIRKHANITLFEDEGRTSLGIQYPVCMMPFRVGSRFLVSSYHANVSKDKNYLFCYDRETFRSFMLDNGFEDNFYETGLVPDLQPVDVHNEELWYSKSGKDILNSFPEREETDNPVLFFVKLKV